MNFNYFKFFLLIVFLPLIAQSNSKPQEALHAAVLKGSSVEILGAIAEGANVDMGIGSQPPLLLAVLLGKSSSVLSLLNNGAKANVTHQGKSLAFHAIKNSDLVSALHLIEKGADFSGEIDGLDAFTYVSSKFNSFRQGAQKQAFFDLMNAMVKNGYNLQDNFNNKDLKNNALYLALKNNQTYHVCLFFGFDNQLKNNPYRDLSGANPDQIFALPDGSTWTPLLMTMKHIMDDKKQLSYTGIHTLLTYNKPDLNKQAKPDGKISHTPLSYCLSHYPYDHDLPLGFILDQLLEKGANLAEAIDIFIKNGGSTHCMFETQWRGSWNLLGMAIYYNKPDAVKRLLEAGVDINALIDPFPLPSGSRVSELYKASDDPYSRMRGPHIPLFYAIQLGAGEIIEMLLKHGS